MSMSSAGRRTVPRRNVLTVIDAATNTKGPSIPLGTSNNFILPQAMAMAPDGDRIYVINDLEETISVVSTETNTVVDTWPSSLVGTRPRAVTVSPDGRRVYVVGNPTQACSSPSTSRPGRGSPR